MNIPFKRTLIILVMLAGYFTSTFADHWYVISENNRNGSIVLEILWSGKLSYRNNDGSWVDIITVHSHNTDNYTRHEPVEVAWLEYDECEVCDPNGDELWVAWRPPEGHYNQAIQLRFVDYDHGYETTYKSAQAFKPGKLNIKKASIREHCGEVRLSWDEKPDNISSFIHSHYKNHIEYRIYRDSSYLATTSHGTTSYTDYGVEAGEEYYYEVQYRITGGLPHPDPWTWEDNDDEMDAEGDEADWEYNYGEKSYPMMGASKERLMAPVYVNDPENYCGDSITIEWQAYEDTANDNTIQRYLLQRATDEGFTANARDYYLNESNTSVEYTQVVPNQNTDYFYRLKTENVCGDLSEDWSDIVSGQALAKPGDPSGLTAAYNNGTIELNWVDNSSTENYFILKRSPDGIAREVQADKTNYLDSEFQVCTRYQYSVEAFNSCGPSNPDTVSIHVNPAPADLLDPTSFVASKGYYPDKVILNWDNSNKHLVDYYEITRYPDLATFEVTSNKKTFTDKGTIAGKLYTYTIQAKVNCQGNIITSPLGTDTGFRVKAGTLSGSVVYEGDIAVKDVEILVETTNDSVQSILDTSNYALAFDGDDHVSVPHGTVFNFEKGFTFQAWIKPATVSGNQVILSKTANNKGYGINLEDNNAVAWIKGKDTTYRAIAANAVNTSGYNHVTASFDGDYLRVYLNGAIADSLKASMPLIQKGEFLIGTDSSATLYYTGKLDEILIWDKARSSRDIEMDYSRILSGQEKGLVAYWRMDINEGTGIFDYSKTKEEFNKNHGDITGASWTGDAPKADQLQVKGRTDEKGGFVISYLRYLGTGNIYDFTPFKGQDSFETLNDRVNSVYFGEGAFSSTLNFKDFSSVKVTGTIQYKNSRCMAKGIDIYIDGEPAIKNGEMVKTDKEGLFEIQVPSTGQHSISAYKKGHTFETGIWPTDSSLYSFVEPVSGIEFIDSTRIRVVGRVVGGNREKEKKPALGLSKNNLGQARIIFKSQLGFGCSTDTAFTDSNTGEYKIDLLPLNYVIKDVDIINNPAIDFGTQEVLYLDSYQPVTMVRDTVFDENGTVSSVDSAWYQTRRDFIYKSEPRIKVTDENDGPFIGEESITTRDDKGNEYEMNLRAGDSGHPVFFAGKEYTARIFVHEKYTNADNDKVDLVPLENAIIRINNDIARVERQSDNTKTIVLTDEKDGDTLYNFLAGEPNFLLNTTYPEYNFTKTLKIEAEIDRVSTDWKPGNNGKGDNYYHAYVMGRKALGNIDFVSGGATGDLPLVTTVLRDPPGSSSSSYIEEGSAFTTSSTVTKSWKGGTNLELVTDFAPDQEITLPFGGPSIIIKGKAGPVFGFSGMYSGSEMDNNSTTYVVNEKISTSGASELVGAREDVFIGSTRNYNFGTVNSITFVPDSLCQQTGGPCACSDHIILNNNQTYRIGLKNKYMLLDSVKTTFVYSQDHIMNYMIPNLEKLRNNLFVRLESYKSNIPADHELYGTNNDDPEWGNKATSTNPLYDEGDSDGPSYTFKGSVDSIRWYNQIIKKWENILEQNEKEKKLASFDKNISFEGGGNSYSYSYSIGESESEATTHGFDIEVSFASDFKFSVMGVGFQLKYTLKGGYGMNWNEGDSDNESVSYGYTLSDGDQGDYFNVDIMQPNDIDELKDKKISALTGPVFKLNAGRSLCPWEGPELTKYYEPIGSIISEGTMQREKPELSVTPNIQNNIPPDQPAVFKLTIGNASESNETMWYNMKIAENSNPHGANISLDGKAIGRVFEIPGGTSYQKTLTLNRVPGIDNYENIKILLYSPCEWAHHTNGGVLHAVDTVSISAYFIPSCTEVALYNPDDQWVMNTTRNDTLPVIVGEYDKNYEGFKKFQVQYKEAAGSRWIGLKSYWNDTTGLNTDEITPIAQDEPYTLHPWDISQIPDGKYDIRAVSFCPLSNNYTEVLRGIIDRIPPHSFGSPHPADGILSPNDEMLIIFNEDIHTGMLNYLNFDIRGILNGSELTHSASVLLDGKNDYMKIPKGIMLGGKSFTFECWIKRKSAGQEYVFSQGVELLENLSIGFDALDDFYIKIGDNTFTTGLAHTVGRWHHYAISFDKDNSKLVIYKDGSVLANHDVNGTFKTYGNIFLGKAAYADSAYFQGNIHGLRLWNTVRSQPDIVANMNKRLVGKEYGLIGNWPMDEAYGSLTKDIVHHRNATVFATWDVYPSGYAYDFPGNNSYLETGTKNMAFNKETDLTIEFWFKAKDGNNKALLSNGKGDGTDKNLNGWCIQTNEQGHISVWNNGKQFEAVSKNYFDGDWHHFALVVDRMGNTHSYIDGEIQAIHNERWQGFGGPYLWIGSRGWFEGPSQQNDMFFEGQMDEVRIWKLARKQDQLKRYMNTKLKGDEPGLAFFMPFETYQEDAGVMVLDTSLVEQSRKEVSGQAINASFSDITPNIVLNRPVEKVNFSYSHKEDRIVFKSTDQLKRIENRVLDITVSNVQDLNGNPMQSPETWSAYVDMGQIRWKEQEMIEEKNLYQSHTFTTEIENLAGENQSFSIENLPVWLSVSPKSGTMPPRSSKTLTFTVSEGLNIGHYMQDIYLHTDFEFDEKIALNLRVLKTPPEWKVNPSDHVYTMNVIGQLYINDVISDDLHDKVAAFVDGECRGSANIEYLEEYDQYQVFMDIYSNTKFEENVVLRVWDASRGRTHLQVNPRFDFQANLLKGTPSTPIVINATDTVYETMPLNAGWNWISFNLKSPVLTSVDSLLSSLNVKDGTEIKGRDNYDQFGDKAGWVGTLTKTGGIKNETMYMMKLLQADTINYSGVPVVPENTPIPIMSGWNWIGFTPNLNMEINDALASLNPTANDIVKGQENFSIYDENVGWLGSLEYLRPNKGYMLYASGADTLIYPNQGIYSIPVPTTKLKNGPLKNKGFDPSRYPSNMSVVAKLNMHHDINPTSGDLLYAQHQGKIHGISRPVEVTDKGGLYFMTILNEAGKVPVQFQYYSKDNGLTYAIDESIIYSPNAMFGTVQSPVVLNIGQVQHDNNTSASSYAYPNPFSDMLNVMVFNANKSDVKLKVYDVLSDLVYEKIYHEMPGGWSKLSWQGIDNKQQNINPGIYFIKIETNTGNSTFKVVHE